jgi:hypothetical protein
MGMTTKKVKGIGKPLIEDAEIEPQAIESVSPETEEATKIEQEISSDANEISSGLAPVPDAGSHIDSQGNAGTTVTFPRLPSL